MPRAAERGRPPAASVFAVWLRPALSRPAEPYGERALAVRPGRAIRSVTLRQPQAPLQQEHLGAFSRRGRDRTPCHGPGFPGRSEGKASACRAGDLGPIPGSGRSPGGGHGDPLQRPCLENPMGRGARWATVHGVAELDRTERLHFALCGWRAMEGRKPGGGRGGGRSGRRAREDVRAEAE